MRLQTLENSEKILGKENVLSHKITQSSDSKQNKYRRSFDSQLKSMSLKRPLLGAKMGAHRAGAFLSSSLFPSSQIEIENAHGKDKILSFGSKSREQSSELSNKKQVEEESSHSKDIDKKEELKSTEELGDDHSRQGAEWNSAKKQSDMDEAQDKKTQELGRGKENKNKLEGQKSLPKDLLNENIHQSQSQKQALNKELENFLKEAASKGGLKESHQKGSEAIALELRQLQAKEAQDTESLVRVAIDSEKWSLQRAHDLQEKKNVRANQNLFSTLKIKNESDGKNLGKNRQEDNASAKKEGQSANSHSIEELTSLFGREESQRATLKNFQNQMQRESVLKETKRLYDELVQKAKINLKADGTSRASIAMRPRNLGRMTLNLETFQKQVQAQIIVESQAVKQILLEELSHFQQELQRQGIQVENLTIRVRESLESQMANERETKSEEQESEQRQNSAMREKGQENSKRDSEFTQNRKEENEDTESASVLAASAEEYGISALSMFQTQSEKHIDISV